MRSMEEKMTSNEERILKDLIELYKEMYNLVKADSSNMVFNKKFDEKFKYSPDEVSVILQEIKKPKRTGTSTLRTEISNINSKEQVQEYFDNTLTKIFQDDVSEEEKKSILESIKISELNHFYTILYDISLPNRCKKIDALYQEGYKQAKRHMKFIKQYLYNK